MWERVRSAVRSVTGKTTGVTAVPILIMAVLLLFDIVSSDVAWIGAGVWGGGLAVLMFIFRGEFTNARNHARDAAAWRKRLPEDVEINTQGGIIIGLLVSGFVFWIVDKLS